MRKTAASASRVLRAIAPSEEAEEMAKQHQEDSDRVGARVTRASARSAADFLETETHHHGRGAAHHGDSN